MTGMCQLPAAGWPTARVATMPEALSATHAHLLSLACDLMRSRTAPGQTVRLLDVGCGDARLLSYLAAALPLVFPDRRIELHGFDIAGHGTQPSDFFSEALARISQADPATPWAERLHLIAETDAWPFRDESLDIVLSNQVLEHVRDGDYFFSELARVLRVGGASVHLYPSAHVIVEPHLGTPFAHRLGHGALLRHWLAFWARFGVSAYRRWSAAQPPEQAGIGRYARVHVEFLRDLTHYRTVPQMKSLARHAGLRATVVDSPGYLVTFLRRKVARRAPPSLDIPQPTRSAVAAFALRYLTSVTLTVTKDSPAACGDAQ